jgi:hypothetical protein
MHSKDMLDLQHLCYYCQFICSNLIYYCIRDYFDSDKAPKYRIIMLQIIMMHENFD